MRIKNIVVLVSFCASFYFAARPIQNVSAQTIAGQTYYISNTGSDDHDGLSEDTAWKTLEHVSEQSFQPGDQILLRRGDTWRETFYISSSGEAGNWLTVGAYGEGNQPRILGSELASTWTQVAANIWRSDQSFTNPYQGYYSYGEVYFESLSGEYIWGDQQDYNAAHSNLLKEFDWAWNDNHIYIYAPGNPGAIYQAVEVPQRDSCIRLPNVDGTYITDDDYVEYLEIKDLELMYAMRHGFYPGYNEIEAHGLKLTNNHIGMIGVKGGSSAYCIAAWHSDMTISHNNIHDCGRRGISLNTYTNYTLVLTIQNVVIEHNHFANGFHTTGPDISSLSNLTHNFKNFIIRHNTFDDSARWAAGINDGCAASSCTSNTIYISAHNSHYSNFYIYNNIIIGSTSRAMLLVDMQDAHVYHNTVYASHPDARPYGLVIFNNIPYIDMRNNLFYGTLSDEVHHDGRLVLDENLNTFVHRDRNLYFQEDEGQPITGSEYGVGGWDVYMHEWETWQQESGYEGNSPAPANPLFVNKANFDFNLTKNSPAVDAGEVIPGINDGYAGLAPDLGALELLPDVALYAHPNDRQIQLTWDVNSTVPSSSEWEIEYNSVSTPTQTTTIPDSTVRAYLLTGLNNYEWYTITIRLIENSSILYNDTIQAMPSDLLVFLPIAYK